jgi:hypothetical protein
VCSIYLETFTLMSRLTQVTTLWDALEHDAGYSIVAFLGWGTPGRRGKSAKWLRRLLFLAIHTPGAFATVSRHLTRGPPGCRRFHVPWSWLRAYAFANYAAGAGRILHCALRAAADRSPPAATSAAVLLAATLKACRCCGAPTRPNPSREEQIGTPPGSRTCRICLCDPRFKHIFHATTLGVRGSLGLSDREWRRLSAVIRARVGTWRDRRFGCTLYPRPVQAHEGVCRPTAEAARPAPLSAYRTRTLHVL